MEHPKNTEGFQWRFIINAFIDYNGFDYTVSGIIDYVVSGFIDYTVSGK